MNRTKTAIIETFWELLEEGPYNKITVKSIVDRCQINRNTFYYHFHDIPEILEYTIKNDADLIIQTYSQFGTPFDCLAPLVEHCLKKRKHCSIFTIPPSVKHLLYSWNGFAFMPSPNTLILSRQV